MTTRDIFMEQVQELGLSKDLAEECMAYGDSSVEKSKRAWIEDELSPQAADGMRELVRGILVSTIELTRLGLLDPEKEIKSQINKN